MKNLLYILLLIPVVARAEWYSATNEYGHHMFTEAREDFEGRYAFSTSSVMPQSIQVEPLPAIFENGIALPDEAGHWWKPVVIDGQIDPIQISNSPLDPEVAASMDAAGTEKIKSARSNRLTRIERIAIDLQQVNAQIEGTNWVDVVLTGISTTAGTWSNANQRATITAIKTALQATKDREQNLKVAVRNLMQATEKVRKEIEP